jgi:hypothetical protein
VKKKRDFNDQNQRRSYSQLQNFCQAQMGKAGRSAHTGQSNLAAGLFKSDEHKKGVGHGPGESHWPKISILKRAS